jgi:hypothetical protein
MKWPGRFQFAVESYRVIEAVGPLVLLARLEFTDEGFDPTSVQAQPQQTPILGVDRKATEHVARDRERQHNIRVTEFSVTFDPRALTHELVEALRQTGFSRPPLPIRIVYASASKAPLARQGGSYTRRSSDDDGRDPG